MSPEAIQDDGLRLGAIERLGSFGPPLAREALEQGVVEIQMDVLAWEGSHGHIHGHLVILWLDPTLFGRVLEFPSVVDALTAALASAIARAAGNSLAELKIRPRSSPLPSSPYRGRH